MTLDQLRAFVAIVEHGSIRAGARHLGIAQSGLTQQLRRLEHSLGTTLFVRASSGVVLTEHGNMLLTRARIILGECHRAEQEFNYLKGDLSGSLNVGASSEACARWVPAALQQLRWAYPKVQVHLASGPSAALLSGIREGRLDFAVTLVSRASDMSDLSSVKVGDSRPAILCRRGHPLADATSIRELGQAQWINTRLLGACGTPSNRLGDWFAEHGLAEPRIAVTVDSLLDTLKLVAETDYLFLGPDFVVEDGTFARVLKVLGVREPIPHSDISLVQRAVAPLAPAARAFAAMLLSLNRDRHRPPRGAGR